ncbi:CAAX geranylgeranyltransferase alpha subunit [Ceratobasidium sp. 428]|nr:CAAX geranylgeranyltransferase alpha subunit [Ceratobasidium sp. 428]
MAADRPNTAADPALSYATDPAWADLTPIPQHEPDFTPLCPILYSSEYRDAMDYFRAILKAGERSKRGLELTEYLIQLNPAHYTVWQYRYETLLALNLPLEDELEWSDEIVKRFIKNYQGWHHRRLLITKLRNPKPELEFITDALKQDSKNYHTWSYRQWLLAEFNLPELWAGELDYIEGLLDEDIRNNSAWHHRYFVVFGSSVREGEADREGVVRRELSFTKQKISVAPNNPSAWNYLRGVLESGRLPMSTLKLFVQPYAEVRESTDPLARASFSREDDDGVVDLDNPRPGRQAELPVPFAVEFLGDVAEEEEDNAKATEIYKSLATKFDPARKRYWEFRIREIAA